MKHGFIRSLALAAWALSAPLFAGQPIAIELKVPISVESGASRLWVPESGAPGASLITLPSSPAIGLPPSLILPGVEAVLEGPALVPGITEAVSAQSKMFLASPDLDESLESARKLSAFSQSASRETAQEGRAASLMLGLVTASDWHALTAQSPAHRGLLQTLDPADVEALRATSALVAARRGEPALLKKLARIERQLKILSTSGSLDEVSRQLSQIADNDLLINKPDISPNFGPDDKSRDAEAARFLPTDASKVARALQNVELPPVLAYKAASLALSDDLKGAFSEIGAAQKISGDLYKIRDQKIIAASLSPYAREASDQRYAAPSEKPVSEDYTSLARLEQQLAVEYSMLSVAPGARKFALANTARTSWGNGHAWLGVRAQLAPGAEPATVILHVRLFGDRTRNQKDVLGALGINALFGAYHHLGDLAEFTAGLTDGVDKKDFEIDYLSIRGEDGAEKSGIVGQLELLKRGLARQILVAPDGRPVALSQAGQEHKFTRWTLLREGRPVARAASPFAGAVPAQEEPILVGLATSEDFAARPSAGWTLIAKDHSQAAAGFAASLYPAARGKQAPPAVSLTGDDSHGVVDFKAKRLNREAWVKGVFADVGGYQSVATRFFEASNSHSIFDVYSFPEAAAAEARYGARGELSGVDYLKKQLAFEYARIGDHTRHSKFGVDKPHARFALVTQADDKGSTLEGAVGLRMEEEPGGKVSEKVVKFAFRGGSWQARRNALAALGVNMVYAFQFRQGFGASLREGLPNVGATITIVE